MSSEKEMTFEIITPQIKAIEVIEPEFVSPKKIEFATPLSLFETIKDENVLFELSEEVKQIEVKEPINFVPLTEVTKEGVVKYTLEDYLEKENELVDSKPVVEAKNTIQDEELDFSFSTKTTASSESDNNDFNTDSPYEMSIEESLKQRASERKQKMKDFNYKFTNNTSNIDEIEKEPAYKRMGLDVTSTPNSNNQSRTSIGTDSNDDVQIRSNNSFLHDNVD
jgi:cell division protein FtsZ